MSDPVSTKTIITIEAKPDKMVEIKMVFEPALERGAMATPDQQIGLHAMQAISEYCDSKD